MSDFESFRRDVGAQVMPPDFDDVLASSRRRRLASVAWSTASVAAVVGAVALGMQGGYRDSGAPVAPAHPTSSTPSSTPPATKSVDRPKTQLTPTQIVNNPSSSIQAAAVSAASPDVKAVMWACGGRHCNSGQRFALTVTDDNFASSHDIAMPGRSFPAVSEVAPGLFYAAAGEQAQLVAANGSVTPVSLGVQTRPLASGEAFVGVPTRSRSYLAVDPRTGVAHPLTVPAGTKSLVRDSDGTLVGVTYQSAVRPRVSAIWSGDGGATWQRHELLRGPIAVDPIPSTANGHLLAFVRGGYSATLYPFDRVYRSTDGGATWETFDETRGYGGDQPYVLWSLVKPDGGLLVNIEAWSDNRRGHPGPHPVGLYQSNGANWSDLRHVPGFPTTAPAGQLGVFSEASLAGYARTPSGDLRLTVLASHNRLYESMHGADNWREVPAR